MQRREIARFHTVVYTEVVTPGYRDRRIYVLYVLDDAGKPTALMPLVEYLLGHGRRRSLAWQREVTRSTGLFIDFLRAHADALRPEKHRRRFWLHLPKRLWQERSIPRGAISPDFSGHQRIWIGQLLS